MDKPATASQNVLGAKAVGTGLEVILGREIISPRVTRVEIQTYAEGRIPIVPRFETAEEWERYARQLREDVLSRVVLRGEARAWFDAETGVEWLDKIEGGPGYGIVKLRYEAVPGLWIPALIYVPESLSGRVPVILNVNGHESEGKSIPYKQIRCINQAKRGMLTLNVEWIGMGQLQVPNLLHRRLNSLDLCGTSGLAVHYLALVRALDLLMSLDHADPERVAVMGLSGGGWQTILISALDTRVKPANPVAGYGSFLTGVRYDDLGDSEQSPCDLGALADYAHLTALVAPRPMLLTYNSKDTCCFQAHHALPPLLDAAAPVYDLYDRREDLRSHVNHDPGTHNFNQENREAVYRMLGDHFHGGGPDFDPQEIPSDGEVKTRDELHVDLPPDNADFQSLALALSEGLPRCPELPGGEAEAREWQDRQRVELAELVRPKPYVTEVIRAGEDEGDGVRATFLWFKLSRTWTVPGVDLVRGTPRETVLLVADGGRSTVADEADRLLHAGNRVIAVDPFFIGEWANIESTDRAECYPLLLDTLGDRALGLQASQVCAIARWAETHCGTGPVTVVAVGPRTGLCALVAAALEEDAIVGLELYGCLGTLREALEENLSVERAPEVFCFGLFEAFDIKQLAALVATRPVVFSQASDRARRELAGLRAWYGVLGVEYQPLQ